MELYLIKIAENPESSYEGTILILAFLVLYVTKKPKKYSSKNNADPYNLVFCNEIKNKIIYSD